MKPSTGPKHGMDPDIIPSAGNDTKPSQPAPGSAVEPKSLSLTKSMAQQEQSPLFSLPSELRLQIYEFALTPSKQDTLGVQTGYYSHSPSGLALLETCRLILLEAEQLFYSTNRLHLISSPQPFRYTLNPKRLAAIKELTLPVYKAEQTLANLQLISAKLPNLESLWLKEVSSSFTNFLAWQNLGDQLVAAMQSFPRLQDAKFVPCERPASGPGDLRTAELSIDAVGRRMCEAVAGKAKARQEAREKPGLLALRPELRIRIYEYLLYIPNPGPMGVPTSHHPPTPHLDQSSTPTVLPILQTNRLLNTEANPLFYALNHLIPSDPLAFLSALSPPRMRTDNPSHHRRPVRRLLPCHPPASADRGAEFASSLLQDREEEQRVRAPVPPVASFERADGARLGGDGEVEEGEGDGDGFGEGEYEGSYGWKSIGRRLEML